MCEGAFEYLHDDELVRIHYEDIHRVCEADQERLFPFPLANRGLLFLVFFSLMVGMRVLVLGV